MGIGIGSNSESANYKYKFQGQERQEELGLNWDSFKWRNYMPDIGRFFNVDPLSEKYAYQSHYNFSENRVVDSRELEGLEATNFMSTFLQPRKLDIKKPDMNNSQLQRYNTLVTNPDKSFSQFKSDFLESPSDFLSNSKAKFNNPQKGDGRWGSFEEGNYIKVDIIGSINNSYVKITNIEDKKDELSINFRTVEGHLEKGFINFNLKEIDSNKIQFTITNISEPDMAIFKLNLGPASIKYAREQQMKSWNEVLDKINKYLGGESEKKVTTENLK
ncbi:DUF1990 family protein [Empedobacter brevis]|uniref:DUF1990 family protein n=1 Tax=Empedobacter brevis TaxID=247 RepID=UPI0030B801F9